MDYEGFRRYCESWQIRANPNDRVKHTYIQNRVFEKPDLIRIEEPLYKYREVGLIGRDKNFIGSIDLVFFGLNDVYICEVKSGLERTRGAFKQLHSSYDFINQNFGILPVMVKISHFNGRLSKRIFT